MSSETSKWLNNMVLIGNTDKRGHAWHYREADQGTEPNHYPGFIPIGDIERRLFFWTPQEAQGAWTYTDTATGIPITVDDPTRKGIIRPPMTFGVDDPGAVMGVFRPGWALHPYKEWLVETASNIMGDTLGATAAGLLSGGARAWVEYSVDESIKTPEGVEFRPNLLSATACDGTLCSTFTRTIGCTVCDNTLAANLLEEGQKVKYKHTKHSAVKIESARQALALVHQTADEFQAQVNFLCNIPVTNKQWLALLDEFAPLPDSPSDNKRGTTMAENKRDQLNVLWSHDQRVAPWQNTAFGVMQAINTWAHHFSIVRNASRPERNMQKMVDGEFDTLDRETWATLEKVLDLQPVA